MEIDRPDSFMMASGVMLCKVVCKIVNPWIPSYVELQLRFLVLEPPKLSIKCPTSFLFDGASNESFCSLVIGPHTSC